MAAPARRAPISPLSAPQCPPPSLAPRPTATAVRNELCHCRTTIPPDPAAASVWATGTRPGETSALAWGGTAAHQAMRRSPPLGAVLGPQRARGWLAAVVAVLVGLPPRRPLQQRRQGSLVTFSDAQAVSAREPGVLGGDSSATSLSLRRHARWQPQEGAHHGAPVPAPGVAATPARVRRAEISPWAAARRLGGASTPTWLGGVQLALGEGSGPRVGGRRAAGARSRVKA